MRILVFGAGAWGTALACHAARAHEVCLLTRSAPQAAALDRERENRRYLPGVPLEPAIVASGEPRRALAWLQAAPADDALLVLAVPTAALGEAVGTLAGAGGLPARLVWLCKGIEAASARLPHQILAARAPRCTGAALSGPSFAQEVAAGLPVALVAASHDDALAQAAVHAFHHGAARIYRSDDVLGVELGGALKNVMAIATGIGDGLALGANARAALVTRGLAEIARLGVAMGARAETFMGLAGLGDLVLTCTGDLSRNRRVGLGLAAGRPLAEVLAALGHVAEGVLTVPAARELAARHRVEMPIVEAVDDVIAGRSSPAQAVAALLAREPRMES